MNFLIRAAAIAAMLHITPIVVLVKRPDAVQALLPRADAYVAREVHLSGTDAHRLHEAVDWSPEDGVLVFYGGTAGSTSVGALEFVRVDTPHGPIEVAVGFTPQGAVRGVVVTKATVEMKPWVLEAVAAGLTDHYRGLKPGGDALAFTVQPSSATAGNIITPAIQVLVRDSLGIPDSAFAGSITMSISVNPVGGRLSGTLSVAPVNGTALFGDLVINASGAGYVP